MTGIWQSKSALCAGAAALLLLAPEALRAQGPASAHGHEGQSETVVVTASLSGEAKARALVGSTVTLIDPQMLGDRETRAVSDILRDVPGVAVSRSGALGGQTQVRIRGSESNHVLVLVDGIEVSDPYQGEFDFATLIADEAARIEVLRGQRSALYGSDAIGGVISYSTLSGREAPGVRLRAEGGSFGTFGATARVAGLSGDVDYTFSGALNRSGGYPTAPGGTRDIGSDIVAASAKLGWAPSDTLSLSAVLRYSFTEADTNNQGASPDGPVVRGREVIAVVDTPGAFYRNKALSGLIRASLTSLDGLMTTSLTAQFADSARDAFASYGYDFGDRGTRYKAMLVNALDFGSDRARHTLTLAIDAEREDYRNAAPSAPDPSSKSLDTLGFVGQYGLVVDDRFALGASLRHDDNSFFADATTWHVEASYLLPGGTRPHAAAGSGVKAPVSYELFGYFDGQYIGNPDLRPEKSTGWEIGIDQNLMDGALNFGATFFKSRLSDEIYTDYPAPDFVATSLNRTSVTRQMGVEISGALRLGPVRAYSSWTWLDAPQSRNVLLDPENPGSFATGPVETQAVRRPRHSGSFNLTYDPTGQAFSATLTLRHNGRMKDLVYTPDFSPLIADLPAFTLVNLNVRYKLANRFEIFARAENLLDAGYQEILTYKAPGRAVYAGLRARF